MEQSKSAIDYVAALSNDPIAKYSNVTRLKFVGEFGRPWRPRIIQISGIISRDLVGIQWRPGGLRCTWIGPRTVNSGTGAPEPAFRPRVRKFPAPGPWRPSGSRRPRRRVSGGGPMDIGCQAGGGWSNTPILTPLPTHSLGAPRMTF